MNNEQSITKPKRKFPIGGILCIVVGLAAGASTVLSSLRYIYQIFRVVKALSGNFEDIEHIFRYLTTMYWFNVGINILGYVFSLIGALLFVVLGIMIIARVHSKLLAVISIAQIALGGFSILHFAYVFIINVLDLLTGYNLEWILRSFFTNVRIDGLLVSLLALTGWILLTVAIFANCKADRGAGDEGNLKILAWLTPASFGAGRLLSGVGAVAYAVFSILFDRLLQWETGSPILYTLFNGLGGGLWSVVMAALYAAAFYFVTDWIIEPYKK